MKHTGDILLEVQILDDGALWARRKDRKALNQADHQQARRLADSTPGVTVADVLRVFGGGRVVQEGR